VPSQAMHCITVASRSVATGSCRTKGPSQQIITKIHVHSQSSFKVHITRPAAGRPIQSLNLDREVGLYPSFTYLTTSASPIKVLMCPTQCSGDCQIYSGPVHSFGVHKVLSVTLHPINQLSLGFLPVPFAVRKTHNAGVEAFLLACASVSRPVRHPIEIVLCWVVLWWYKSRRGCWCTWCAGSELSEQYLLSVFAKPAHSSEEVARNIALGCGRRVILGYEIIGPPEPWLVFCGSDTVSAHGVAIPVRFSASSVLAIEIAAIWCERVALRCVLIGDCEAWYIVVQVRTRITVVESPSLGACSLSKRVRNLGWCFERHVYTRQQNAVQVIRKGIYTWMYTVVRYVV
jgi:hypothetical protein